MDKTVAFEILNKERERELKLVAIKITKEQHKWVRDNCLNLSRMVRKMINMQMKVNDE